MAFSNTLVLIYLLLQFLGTHSAIFTIINDCNDIIWPAIKSNDGSPPLPTTGFSVGLGQSETITMPGNWSGRLWGRTHCAADAAGKFSCVTGDCGSSAVECGGGNLSPPATALEFTLNGPACPDTYVLSTVDGYNLPVRVEPQGETGPVNCGTVSCVIDVNSGSSPTELRVTSGSDNNEIVGLNSACGAFEEAQYCCSTGMSNSRPTTCNPNSYSDFFKKSCPQARTFANDDDTATTFTCQSADYFVRFCPSGSPSTGTSSAVTGNGSSSAEDDSQSTLDSFYEKKENDTKLALWIGAVVVILLGILFLLWAWPRCSKSSKSNSKPHPCRSSSSSCGSVCEDRPKFSLKLNSGVCYLPHPDKKDKGGQDAHFICADEQVIGVADGVGGYKEDSGLFARELMSNAVLAIKKKAKDPLKVLEEAYSKTKAKGGSTACIISLTGKELKAVNLGDSGFMVVRDGCKVFRSESQQHAFNTPYHLAKFGGNGVSPSSGQVYTVGVTSGDVIVTGSDGLFDNLYDYEIIEEVVDALRVGLKPKATAKKLADLAREIQYDRTRLSPFRTEAHEKGGWDRRKHGGKDDDTTVIISYVEHDRCR